MRKKLIGALLLLASCNNDPDDSCYSATGVWAYTNYPRTMTYRSESLGYKVSDPDSTIDPAKMDITMANTLECVQRVWPTLTVQDRTNGWCRGEPQIEIKSCLMIIVPPDWYTSQCTEEEVFPCEVPVQSCVNKGQDPNSPCPCACRAITQGLNSIITAPNMELLPAQLTQIMTGCDQIWGIPLAECGNPTLVAK